MIKNVWIGMKGLITLKNKIMDKEFATYNRHYKDTAEGHIFLQKRGACTITLEGAMAMTQKELDKFAEIMVKALNEHELNK